MSFLPLAQFHLRQQRYFGSMISANTSVNPAVTIPCIRLDAKPQLAEARCQEDDWTGTTDAAARRRAQTRLNTRAYRKRKALAKKTKQTSDNPSTALIKSEPLIECWDESQQSVRMIPSSQIPQLHSTKTPLITLHSNNKTAKPSIIFPLCPDHLITLLQYNALRALAVNRTLISGIFTTPHDCSFEEVIHTVAFPPNPSSFPANLLPTFLQQTVPHGDWIDTFPSPGGRNMLIRAAGTFDEDDLWADCIGGMFEGFPDDEITRRGIVAWDPPWEVSGWEMTEGFLRKWGWLFGRMPGAMEATNRWRRERGEEALDLAELLA